MFTEAKQYVFKDMLIRFKKKHVPNLVFLTSYFLTLCLLGLRGGRI
jgi:hypothetical protein